MDWGTGVLPQVPPVCIMTKCQAAVLLVVTIDTKKDVRFPFISKYMINVFSLKSFQCKTSWIKLFRLVLETCQLSFLRFPVDTNLWNKCINCIRIENWVPSQFTVICSEHFEKDCFITDLKNQRLKPSAFPTIFKVFPKYLLSQNAVPRWYLERKTS